MLEDIVRSGQRDVHRAFRQLDTEAALIELGDDRPLQLIALVDERQAEREAEVAAENLGVLGPGDDRCAGSSRSRCRRS
jgi:hypothetical protein